MERPDSDRLDSRNRLDRLEALGWSPAWAAALSAFDPGGTLAPARVVTEHKRALHLLWSAGDLLAEVSGRLRYLAAGPEELPGVGDWVGVAPRPEDGRGTVHVVLPRRTALLRKAPERPAAAQLLAANVDCVFIVTSANRELRPRRIERMLALAREGGVEAVVVLNKIDVAENLAAMRATVERAAPGAPVIALSAQTGEGLEALEPHLGAGRSVVLLGSSGVGKSTLVNRLLGSELLATSTIREADKRGRHTTTRRELIALPAGGVLIDTPGLREVGLLSDASGLDSAFPDVEALLGACRFNDCGHGNEPGCALRSALDDGRLDPARWAAYQKLTREVARLESRRSSRARHERRKKMKKFARQVRQRMKDKRSR